MDLALNRAFGPSKTAVTDAKHVIKVAVTFMLNSMEYAHVQEIFIPFRIQYIPTPSNALLDCTIHDNGQLTRRVTKYPRVCHGTAPTMYFR